MTTTPPTPQDWNTWAWEYRKRTGDEIRYVYLALLAVIGSNHPRVMTEAMRSLERIYPDGLSHPRAGEGSEPVQLHPAAGEEQQ
jgi:hypothetical protein